MRTWEEYKETMRAIRDFWQVAKLGDIKAIRQLARDGHDINARDHRGYSPLMISVYAGHFEASEVLLELGADPNSADNSGNTVLMGACFKGNKDLVMKLLERGARLEDRNSTGMSAYEFALTFGRVDLAEYLAPLAGNPVRRFPRAVALVKILYSRMRSA